ncbi:MAG TPA: hypothetical protein VFZ62_00715 [Candidatus Saccharimonadales bacterium]
MVRRQFARLSVLSMATLSVASIVFAPFSMAFEQTMQDGADSARGIDQAVDLFGASGIFTTVTNVLLFIVGAISVIMVVIGGLRYVLSGGNSSNITTAKNTILYAIVGLIVSLLAYALVNFVITSFVPSGAGSTGGTNV